MNKETEIRTVQAEIIESSNIKFDELLDEKKN